MNKVKWLLLVFLIVSLNVIATQPAGQFGPALIDGNSEYSSVSYRRDQFAFEYYSDFNGYHTGEDWNAVGVSDSGHPLYALGTGRVVWVDDRSESDSIGKTIYVRYKLPDGKEVNSVYIHLKEVKSYLTKGSEVKKGERIARIGNGNGFYGSNTHLHWEIQTDLNIPIRSNSYLGEPSCSNPPTGCPNRAPMIPSNILKYTSPSLFVDDRSRLEPHIILQSGKWINFTVDNYAPSTTAYLDVGGNLYSIKKAIEAGLIGKNGVIYQDALGTWYAKKNVMDIHFEPGVKYAILLNSGVGVFYTMPPSYKYRNDRALFDMVRVAKEDSRFDKVKTETFASYSENDVNYYYQKMAIRYTRNDGSTGGAYFYHATSKKNPLIRFVKKYKIDSATWEWVTIDKNRLY